MAFSVRQVAEWIQGRVANLDQLGSNLDSIQVQRPAPLGKALPHELAFFFSRAFEQELATTNPGILITGEPFVKPLQAAKLPFWGKAAVIACENPYLAMALLSERFAPGLSSIGPVIVQSPAPKEAQIHSTAVVADTAKLGPGVKVGPHCVIEEGAVIGANTVLYPGCFIGPKCILGAECVLFPNVVLYEYTQLGNRVRIHAGSVLGSDGFGYAPRKTSRGINGHQKIFHLGRVEIGDDVEIGANSCVDRGTIGETRIDPQAKLDNLVHVGHNSHVHEGAIICGGTCLAGNASVGKYAYVGGLTGIGNHVHVGDGAQVGALCMVTKDVETGGTAVGNPQREYKEHFRAHALLSRLLVERRSK